MIKFLSRDRREWGDVVVFSGIVQLISNKRDHPR